MRSDVIDDVRARYNSALQTELAQRMLHQLEFTQPSPARSFIEVIPLNRVAANSRHKNSHHRVKPGIAIRAAYATAQPPRPPSSPWPCRSPPPSRLRPRSQLTSPSATVTY